MTRIRSMACCRLVASVRLSLLLGSLAPAAGAVLGPPICDDSLPAVVRLAIPQEGTVGALDPLVLKARIAALFQEVYAVAGVCREARRLQVNVALGDEYQIADWLAQGRIDAGVTTDVGLFLLMERDRQPLVELKTDLFPELAAFLPRFTARLRSFEGSADGLPIERRAPLEDFEALLRAVWDETEGVAPSSGCDGVERRPVAISLEAPSHLSTAGFAALAGRAASFLEGELGPVVTTAERERAAARSDCFWERFLDRTHFTFARTAQPPGRLRQGQVLIQSSELQSQVEGYRSHLVLAPQAAARLLAPESYEPAQLRLPDEVQSLMERCGPPPPEEEGRPQAGGIAPGTEEATKPAVCRVPVPVRPWLDTDPYFGTRTYGFKTGESLELLRRHQRFAEAPKLALVLPGGGVKAVYQSALIDQLYGRPRKLRNVLAPARDPQALAIDAVIGTSGGALIGYFVARLGERGPFNLSQLLWESKPGTTLDSSDIFDPGDLLRYASADVIFGIFCLCLGLFSFQTSRRLAGGDGERYPVARWRLIFALWTPMALAPILVRAVNGAHGQEHIPASEGLFYLICTLIAIFADQCFIVRPQQPQDEGHVLHPAILLAPGALLIALSLGTRAFGLGSGLWHEQPLLVLGAFGPLLLLTVGLGFIVPIYRTRAWPTTPSARLRISLVELLGAYLLAALALGLPVAWWSKITNGIPFFLVGLLLVFFLLWFGPSVRMKVAGEGGFRFFPYYGGLALTTILTLAVCGPELPLKKEQLAEVSGSLWVRASHLDLPIGSFLVCTGVLLILGGVLLALARAREYRIEQAREFRSALGLSLALVTLVNLLLYAVSRVAPAPDGDSIFRGVSFLELTVGYWKWLIALSFLASVAVIVGGAFALARGHNQRLSRGLAFLCGSHPNAILVDRRFVRVAFLGLTALAWWNLLLAPALYGNKRAQKFLDGVVDRFEAEVERTEGRPPQLRAQFATPANILERDGTRNFLVLPPGQEECQPIARRPGRGAVWNQFTVRDPLARDAAVSGCPSAVAWTQEQIESVIFASGSPFPLFPAHQVAIPRAESRLTETVALVDGGYSNNEPVQAAVDLGAKEVLLIRSSSAAGPADPGAEVAHPEGDLLHALHGPLVGDLSRLAGFLFERSQQQDRLSRQELFVLALSPRPRRDWPELFDFRTEVVERLRASALEDLDRRIGAVESWGPPRFQYSIDVARAGAGPKGGGAAAVKATSSGRPAAR